MTSSLPSVCVYCASSPFAATPALALASELGAALARAEVRLVYGGGSLGLMGACARAARDGGGQVLGVMPRFLTRIEPPQQGIETVIVGSMHARKMRMFRESDGFVILPGAIGTLEEAVEVISWRRLGLHAKPIVFLDPDGWWSPLIALFTRFEAERLVPADFAAAWQVCVTVEEALGALVRAPQDGKIVERLG